MYKWRLETRDTYYVELVKWWKAHNFPVLPSSALPSRIFIAYDDNKDVLAIPVFVSDADFCYLGFITINPEASRKDRLTVIPYLMDVVKTCMKYQGYKRFIITCNISGLMKSLEKSGFEFLEKTNYYFLNL
ncbi:hypothetical protein [Aquimarina algiphila]|uniref:GNAT family N-acetyltransferase n=1 Tax=Aquimarina algiphila TaxID=2047982 RepID=A0A554VRJ0_9FLAO|nr:hypothetical protein [Aquimarina algiphila]TSE11272.1 hypothetical protein FOF46_01190 [Aquimarina algiphila]